MKKPRVHLSREKGESSSVNDSIESSISGDDDLFSECYWSSEVPNDEILLVNKSTNTIVWSRLTKNEKSLLDDAKDKALLKYINRNAWRPIKRVTSNSKKTCPIVFVLKWKNGAAHARVCLQGFKHEDSTTTLLNTESPTMSRIGRSFIFLVLVHKRWKAFAAGAPDALLQGMNVEDLGIDTFTDPVGDVRKRFQRLMNLANDEVLKMLKSGFGDVRAPRLWYDKAARDLCQIGFVRHPLDRCVFMSFEGIDLPKSVSEGMERLDGILGLHVDDFVGGGEGMSHVAVKGWNHVPVGVPSFASRVKWLKTKLELGSIHLGLSFPFTGIQLTQSSNFECIHLSLENYLQKVKPIALSKERRQSRHAETTAQEKPQLRGLTGSMNWLVTQLMLYGAASLSIQAANVEKSILEDVHEANKTLRFLKANAAVELTYVRLGALTELSLGTYSDGSWATRRDGASQGGYLQFVMTRSAVESGAPVPLVVTDWASKKVGRISRASLDVEAQAGVVAVDALEFSKLFYAGMLMPSVSMQDDGPLREKFDLARSDLNSPFAHPVCCMDPLRLTVHKIYAQHAPTKLPRVDKILSKHEGHGQRLLCALICKHNLSLVSVLSFLEGNSSGVPIGTGPRLSLPLCFRRKRFNRRILTTRVGGIWK